MKERNRERSSEGSKSRRQLLGLVPDEDFEEEEITDLEEDAAQEPEMDSKRIPDGKPDGNRKLRLVKALELEEDEEAWEEDEDGEKERPWVMALTFLGLAVLAAIICAILWYVTHPSKPADGGQDTPSGVSGSLASGEDPSSEAGAEGGSVSGQEGDTEGGLESGQDQAAEGNPLSGQGQGAEENPASGQSQGAEGDLSSGQNQGTEGNQEQASGEEAGSGSGQMSGSEDGSSTGQTPGEDDSQEIADGQDQEPVSGTTAMKFTEQQESVTPKDVVNLRSVPTTTDESNIVVQCQNGEILTRTGINQDTGWSRIDYNGQTLYAVNQYLTTNLDYKPPVQASNPNRVSTISGRIIIFSNCDDWISPKEYVNLRSEPSTTEGDTTVSCQLNYGEKAHRTGYSADSGWSRVEYDGKVLYVVTSLMYVVESD